jgi:NADPH:quinone reductase-like Zn-dependent oxidoreductase
VRGVTDKAVLVTGAAGGVGSTAVAILSHLGYTVVVHTLIQHWPWEDVCARVDSG